MSSDTILKKRLGSVLSPRSALFSIALIGLIYALEFPSASAQQLVANSSVALADISKENLGNIFTGKAQTLPNGTPFVIVVAKESPATEKLLSDLTGGQSIDQFQSSWKRLVFVGKGKMPTIVTDNKELLKKVAETPGAIGLAENGPAPDVKVIAIKDN